MKAPGGRRRAQGLASYGVALTLLASIALSVIPLSTPALADPPRPPAVQNDTSRDEAARQRDIKRERLIADELKRQAELQRNAKALEASALRREIERQTERVRQESVALAARADRRTEGADKFKVTPPGSPVPVPLQACNDATPQEALAPAGSVLLIGKAWLTRNRGQGEAFAHGTSVELSIGGVAIPHGERFFVTPAPLDHPTLGRVWITRWEYPLAITTPSSIAVSVRWTIDRRLADFVFNDNGSPLGPQDFSVALSCTLIPAVTVSGRITGEGSAISDGVVAAFTAASIASVGGAVTDANGEFALLLRPGDYRFQFSSVAGPWLAEWWNDRRFSSEATVVTIAIGVASPRLIVDLARGALISGRVTDAVSHAAVAGVDVIAQDGCCEAFFARADADGRYRMVVRRNVSFKISFRPPPSPIAYLERWWDGKRSFSEADWLAVGDIDIPNIDAELERGVFVRGRVSDAENGQPLANAFVSASAVSATCCESFFASTNAQGEYAMPVRTNVSIVVGFFPPASPVPYVASYWNGRRSFSEADHLAVGTSDIHDINGALERGVFLRGRVTDATTGAAVLGASVSAYVGACCGESYFAQTAADGTYVAAVRKNSTLHVQFFGPFGAPYLSQWYQGRATLAEADPVTVTTVDVGGIDAALERGVFLRGRVTEADTGVAIARAGVAVSPAGTPCCESIFGSTDPNGDYAVVVRKNTSVQVSFTPPFDTSEPLLSQWYRGKPGFETADVVPVGASDVLGIDAALERGVFVRGRVTDAATLAPIAGVGVLALDLAPPCCTGTFASTDSGGEYRVVARKGASVKISFAPPFGSSVPYIGQWYNAKPSFNEADVVTTGSADVLGINAALETGVFVRGRVTDAVSGDGIAGVGVNVQRVDVPCCQTFFVSTDAEGRYAVTLRPNISVKVLFIPSFNDPLPHLSEWWNDKVSFNDADTLAIGSIDIGSIDAVLERGVLIRGHVTDAATGQGLQVNVNAYVVDDTCCENYFAIADADGFYAMPVRRNIVVKVGFSPPFGSDFVGEFYDNKTNFATADSVIVGEADVSGIDAALAHGVRVSGRVTDTTGAGISGASVNIEMVECCDFIAGAQTVSDGTYSVFVSPGSYKVAFYPPFGSTLLSEYFDNQPHSGVANVVDVGDTAVTGIDAVLEPGVFISGRVTDATTGLGVADVVASTSPVDSPFVGFARTDADGRYSIASRPGSYKVHFSPPPTSDLLSEFYDDKATLDSATVVATGASGVTGIDAVLDHGVRLSGRVRDPEGTGVAGVTVHVENAVCCIGVAGTATSSDGTYSLIVRPGSYKVGFHTFGSDLLTEYYDDKRRLDQADVVVAAAGIPLANIDATLERGVRLSGRVIDAVTLAGVGAVNVSVQTSACCEGVAGTQTAADGTYSLPVLPGTYKIGFFPQPGSGLRYEYYNDRPDFDVATELVVGTSAVTEINAALEHLVVAPTIIDAFVTNVAGPSTDFVESEDAFMLTFSGVMDTGTAGDTLRIQDQDGTLVLLRCGLAPNHVACDWDPAGTSVLITVEEGLTIPAIGEEGSGTTPGLQIPFNVVTMSGFADTHGLAPNILGSSDRLVDFE